MSQGSDPNWESGVIAPVVEPEQRTRLCPMYKVFLHNDDRTPMAWVVQMLTGIFALEHKRSTQVMYEAHETGVAFVIALSLEQAEFRVGQAHSLSRGSGWPLTFTYEPE